MAMKEPGWIERAELRDVWPNEAADFTPWLAEKEHLSELGAALGLELEPESGEAPVGTFSLDLLAREIGAARAVVVENQLEPTDHDHLGKPLTYASGYDANVVVWLAKQFRDEHRQALDWLNRHTDENTGFFGVAVELWKIDGSRPAPHFNIVAAPNEWRRQPETSDRNRRYREFFQKLVDALRARDFTNASKAQPQSWYAFSSGYGQLAQYAGVFGSKNTVRVEVYIGDADRDRNKFLFDRLIAQRESIESALSERLDWQRLDDRKASRIALHRSGGIDDDPETLTELESWMVDKLLAFKRVFGPRLNELLATARPAVPPPR